MLSNNKICLLVGGIGTLALGMSLLFSQVAGDALAADLNNPAARANARAMANASGGVLPPPGDAFAPSAVYTASPTLAPGAVSVSGADTALSDSLDDYDSQPVSSIADPIEPWNRFWFRFNDIFYIHIVSPVYNGWKFITPQFFRTGLGNLFYNLMFPTRFVNSLLQFRFLEAGVEFSRFMVNMMGGAGLVDISRNMKTIVPVDPSGEDFGQTLGRWGFGPGFYIIWPIIGPSSLRDTVGRIGDLFTDPLFYVHPWEVSSGTGLVLRFNDVGGVLGSYRDLRSIAVDPYLAMREAYINLRQAQIQR